MRTLIDGYPLPDGDPDFETGIDARRLRRGDGMLGANVTMRQITALLFVV